MNCIFLFISRMFNLQIHFRKIYKIPFYIESGSIFIVSYVINVELFSFADYLSEERRGDLIERLVFDTYESNKRCALNLLCSASNRDWCLVSSISH